MTAVVVDGRGLGDASALRGIGTYVRNVVTGLGSMPDLDVRLLARSDVAGPPGVTVVPVRRRASGRFASLEHQLRLPLDLRRAGADVVHIPAFDPPWRSPAPWVVTLHDVIPLVRNDRELAWDRRRWQRYGGRLRRAAAVIAVSRYSADEATAVLGLDRSKVHVIHHGIESAFHPGDGGSADADPYLLYVGSWAPYKGYGEAIAVVDDLADAGYPHRLKFAGPQDAWMLGHVERLRARSRHPGRVDVLGFVDDLPALYRGASAVVSTSRHEGFGLPAVEAMACGVPVVAFSNTAVAEVVADGGILVPDGDVAAFVSAVRRLLDDDREREAWVQAALARSSAFDWKRSVEAHADILRSVARR